MSMEALTQKALSSNDSSYASRWFARQIMGSGDGRNWHWV